MPSLALVNTFAPEDGSTVFDETCAFGERSADVTASFQLCQLQITLQRRLAVLNAEKNVRCAEGFALTHVLKSVIE